MEIGIGLPNPVPELDGRRIPAWAAQAEARGFSSLATIDRLSFPNHDSMITLAAAAGVTERIRLFTNILLLPTRQPVLLAKEAASLASVSGGRFVLGVGVGGREDDYVVSETSFASRGRRADRMLEQMTQAWRGGPIDGSSEPVVPAIPGGTVPLMIGGSGPAAVRRTVTYGIGWTGGGAPPEHTAPVVQKVRAAWAAAGRQGEPRIAALAYFSLGDHVRERSTATCAGTTRSSGSSPRASPRARCGHRRRFEGRSRRSRMPASTSSFWTRPSRSWTRSTGSPTWCCSRHHSELANAASNAADGGSNASDRTNSSASGAPTSRSIPASSHSIEIGPA